MPKLVGGMLVVMLYLSIPSFAQQEIQEAEAARQPMQERQALRQLLPRVLQGDLQSGPRFTIKRNNDHFAILMAIGGENYDLSSDEGLEELQRTSAKNARAYCERLSKRKSLTIEQAEKLQLAARVQIARNVRKLRSMTCKSANPAEMMDAIKLASQIVGGAALQENESLFQKVLASITQNVGPQVYFELE